MDNNQNNINKDEIKVAEQNYDVSGYESSDQVEKGIATTHEQVSDDYMEGTIDGKIDKLNSKGELASHKGKDIPRKSFK